MKKLYLIVVTGISAGMMFAQTGRKATFVKAAQVAPATSEHTTIKRTCGTVAPGEEWEQQFQKLIEQYVKDHPELTNGKVYVNYTIPVIFHVIHGGQAVGTYPNLAQGQINSQVQVLNADYAGTGLNVSNYPANAFVNYAASLPAANKDANGRVKIANTGIQFCLATKDPMGNPLPEPGIDRINYNTLPALTGTFTSKNPASSAYNNIEKFMDFIDNYIKFNTIWDPTRYFNVWVSDVNGSLGVLGYATFPAGSGLSGLSSVGGPTNDGVWIWAKACGSSAIYPGGTYAPPFDKGRTLTHEAGHWLGLRHIGGDALFGCGNDYCNDTPPNKGGYAGGQYGQNYGCPTYPLNANQCSGNVDGDMFMNFMDYTDDACMYMFTVDQTTRMQTAMANGTYRSQLTASAATLCASPSPAANACFTMPSTGCINTGISLTNCSTGSPTPTYTWSANPSTGVTFSPNQSATNPTVTFANTGTYTITLAANNGTLSTISNVISISSCITPTVCNDTLSNASNQDTMTVYIASPDPGTSGCSPKAGYVVGSNCYKDKEKAEWYSISTYSHIPTAYIKGAIVLFYKNGTRGTGGNPNVPVNCILYNGTMSGGPTSSIATSTANLGQITASTPTNSVQYFGDPNLGFVSNIILPYKYNFNPAPVAPLSNGFFVSVTLPTSAGDTAVIFHTTVKSSPGTMWEKWNNNSWHNLATAWGGSLNLNGAILPIMSCTPTSLEELNKLEENIMIMPNPSNGLFNIITTFNEKQNLHFEVMNTLGQVLNKGEFQNVMNNYLTLNLSHYENGIYFLKITNGTEKILKRLIINR